ncbi:Uma2 family endonuclease [Spirosoma gilvum]
MEEIIEQVSDYELQRGKPIPTLNHSIIQGNLTFALKLHYRNQFSLLPEINLSMPERPDTVPDIAIYPKLQIDFLHDISSMTEMPLTVIEIVSPSQSDAEIIAKFERYFNAGVQSCWLVMPIFKAISVYTSLNQYKFFTDDTTLTDPTTGIELVLNEIFA